MCGCNRSNSKHGLLAFLLSSNTQHETNGSSHHRNSGDRLHLHIRSIGCPSQCHQQKQHCSSLLCMQTPFTNLIKFVTKRIYPLLYRYIHHSPINLLLVKITILYIIYCVALKGVHYSLRRPRNTCKFTPNYLTFNLRYSTFRFLFFSRFLIRYYFATGISNLKGL